MGYLDWHVGMKVVCIRVDSDDPPRPALDEVCTVSFIYALGDDVMVDLVEHPSPETYEWHRGYQAIYFRPVQTRKTDISIFQQLLAPSKVKERETA